MKNKATTILHDVLTTGSAENEGNNKAENKQIQIVKGAKLSGLYEVLSDAKKGGMGSVYQVRHLEWRVALALKQPHEHLFQTEEQKGWFIRECETWIRLGLHPNIVTCYYVRELFGVPSIFSQWMEGGSLRDWILSGKLYEGSQAEQLKRILDISIQFARGLHYAHEKGVIHQDVKPDNLLMTEEGDAKVADFGIAQAFGLTNTQQLGQSEQTLFSKCGAYTPGYCSAEQMSGQELTRRTDIWSWAVSVLEMLVGERLWQNGVIAGMAASDYLDGARVMVPQTLRRLLYHCFLEKESDRPRDFEQIEAVLLYVYREEFGQAYHREKVEQPDLIADNLNNYALSFLDLGKEAEAHRLLDEALLISPEHEAAVYNQSLLLWRQGKLTDTQAIEKVERVAKNHGTWEMLYRLAMLHMERGDQKSAQSLLDRALERSDGDESVLMVREQLPCIVVNKKEISGSDIDCAAFDRTGETLAVGFDRMLILYDTDGMQEVAKLSMNNSIKDLCFTPDERFIVCLLRNNEYDIEELVRVEIATMKKIPMEYRHVRWYCNIWPSKDQNVICARGFFRTQNQDDSYNNHYQNYVLDADTLEDIEAVDVEFTTPIKDGREELPEGLILKSHDQIVEIETGRVLRTLSSKEGRLEVLAGNGKKRLIVGRLMQDGKWHTLVVMGGLNFVKSATWALSRVSDFKEHLDRKEEVQALLKEATKLWDRGELNGAFLLLQKARAVLGYENHEGVVSLNKKMAPFCNIVGIHGIKEVDAKEPFPFSSIREKVCFGTSGSSSIRITQSEDKKTAEVTHWNQKEGIRKLLVLRRKTAGSMGLCMTPDEKKAVLFADDRLYLFDLALGNCTHQLKPKIARYDFYSAMTAMPDNRRVALVMGPKLFVYDVIEGVLLERYDHLMHSPYYEEYEAKGIGMKIKLRMLHNISFDRYLPRAGGTKYVETMVQRSADEKTLVALYPQSWNESGEGEWYCPFVMKLGEDGKTIVEAKRLTLSEAEMVFFVVRLLPDSRHILTLEDSNTINLWNIEGELLYSYKSEHNLGLPEQIYLSEDYQRITIYPRYHIFEPDWKLELKDQCESGIE